MGFEPMRMSFGDEFTGAFGELNRHNTLAQARLAQAGLDSFWNRKANDEVRKASEYGRQGSSGFGWGDALKLGGSLLGAAKGAGLFGGGGSSFGSSFTSKNFEMPSYMSGAGNFSSFWGG